MQVIETEEQQSLNISAGVPVPQREQSYTINRDELDEMVNRGLLKRTDKLFVYFALMLDYPDGTEKLYIHSFCERWAVPYPDAMIAIARLEKKKVLLQRHEQLSFKFTYPSIDEGG